MGNYFARDQSKELIPHAPNQIPFCEVYVKFKCRIRRQYWDLLEDVTRAEPEITSQEIQDLPDLNIGFKVYTREENPKNVDREFLRLHSLTFDAIREAYPISESNCRDIVRSFSVKLKELLENVRESREKVLEMVLPMNIELIYTYRLHELSIRDENINMVPTSEAAIKLLKNTKVEASKANAKNINGCMICLEKIEKDAKIYSLPCSHVYHGECIIKWLNTSHYCPICRFEMPIKN